MEQLREEVRRGGDPRVLRGRAWVTWGAGARRSGGTNGMFCVCRMVLGAAPHLLGPSQQGNTGRGWVPSAQKPSTCTKPAAPHLDPRVSWTPGL